MTWSCCYVLRAWVGCIQLHTWLEIQKSEKVSWDASKQKTSYRRYVKVNSKKTVRSGDGQGLSASFYPKKSYVWVKDAGARRTPKKTTQIAKVLGQQRPHST
jgi:hypothetical protein